MSTAMMELQNKQQAVELIKEKLTPEYLASATRAILEQDRDEVDNIVRAHHELYDQTNWSAEPAAFTIGYQTLKERIGTLKDEALKTINDQLGKLEIKEAAAKASQGAPSGKDSEVKGKASDAPKNGSGGGAEQGGAEQGGTERGEQKESLPNPPENPPETPSNGEQKAESPATKDFDIAVAKILNQFEELKADIKKIREEAVLKESLANQKIQGLETKLTRQIREAEPGTTTRDEGEFQIPKKTPVAETYKEKIARLLKELKDIIGKATKTKGDLTFKSLITTDKDTLIERKRKVGDAITQFHLKVALLEVMGLSSEEKAELSKYKEEGSGLGQFFETTFSDAIDVKDELEKCNQATPSTSNEDPQQVGSPTVEVDFFDNPQPDPQPVPPPKPPRRPAVPDNESSNAVTLPLRLETINLPFFNGELTEWSSFKDLFVYLIHQNNQLSDIVKFHQLRSKLRGPALDTIRGYQITGINYLAAWSDLTKRYDRTDNLVQEYIRKFLEVPAILHKPNLYRIRAIIDATNQMIRALPNLGADVHHWDPFICLIVTSKLDEETRTEWRQFIGRRTNTTIGELIEFLETQAIDHQPSQGDRLSQMLRGQGNQRNPKRNVFAINNGPSAPPKQKRKCVICKGDHFPWQCPKLRKECAKVRAELIRSVGACVKCLLKHEVGACNKSNCPYCGEEHNSMLCTKKERDQDKGKRSSQGRKIEKPAINRNSSGDWDDTN